MTCDKLGYESLIELLELFCSSSVGAKRTLTLDKPDIYSASSSLKKTAENKVVISSHKESEYWNLRNEDSKLYLFIGINSSKGLICAIKKAEAGEYDFSFGGTKGQNLWFW